ncbi:MAG: helix-turn-helix domain-containing protein [Clostridiales bacterium]|nr:helix-turn-helix domain-containing protein [Clostridiales bacterium]
MAKREYNKNNFGGYLYELRKERGIGFDEFRADLGVSKAYLNDVETDACRPPTPEVQIKMIRILCKKKALSQEQIAEFYTLAAARRGELPADVMQFLTLNAHALDEIRANPDYKLYWQKYGL